MLICGKRFKLHYKCLYVVEPPVSNHPKCQDLVEPSISDHPKCQVLGGRLQEVQYIQ